MSTTTPCLLMAMISTSGNLGSVDCCQKKRGRGRTTTLPPDTAYAMKSSGFGDDEGDADDNNNVAT